MDSVHPGRLRPWVRFRTPHGLVEARPDDSIPVSEWADILWQYVIRERVYPIQRRVTACRKLAEPPENWQPSWPGNYWRWLAGRGIWPTGLLQELALVDERADLLEPASNQPGWTGVLATVATHWFGVRTGVIVWNSLCQADGARARELRWHLAVQHGICPARCSEKRLEFVREILSQAHPDHLPYWRALLKGPLKHQFELQTLWSSQVSSAQLLQWTAQMDEAVVHVLETAPDRFQEFLGTRISLKELDNWETGEMFLSDSHFALRMQVLQCLQELERDEPSQKLLNSSGRLAEAARSWQQLHPDLVAPEVAQALELEPAQLGRLMHLRQLNQRPKDWPKSLRRFLERHKAPRSSGHQLRQLLKVKQNFCRTLRQEEQYAWRRLVSDCLDHLLCELFGLSQAPAAELRQAAWLLTRPAIKVENSGAFAERPTQG